MNIRFEKTGRYRAALAISDGACNPSGIAHAFIEGCRDARQEGADTAALYADPALRLMVHQLAHLMGAFEIDRSLTLWDELRERCEEEDYARKEAK